MFVISKFKFSTGDNANIFQNSTKTNFAIFNNTQDMKAKKGTDF